MAKENILVVEDEEDILELIAYNLKKEGYQVRTASTGEKALSAVASAIPDLILLDLMLPEIDGLEVCRKLKRESRFQGIPIIMLTAKGEESDVVTGLELGADDYITKPFSPKILIARLRAVLRRKTQKEPGENDNITTSRFDIDPGRHEVSVDGELIELTYTEFRVLHLLTRRPGWVYTRYQIVDAVRGPDYPVTERAVDVQIVGLRKKLGDAGNCIKTVRGVGYKFQE